MGGMMHKVLHIMHNMDYWVNDAIQPLIFHGSPSCLAKFHLHKTFLLQLTYENHKHNELFNVKFKGTAA